jgi:hypothetical protein
MTARKVPPAPSPSPAFDHVLKRMLDTPPKQHKVDKPAEKRKG